jgi:hypothetical protein
MNIKSGNPQGGAKRSALEGEDDHAQRGALRQLVGLSEDEVRIVERKE